MLGSNARHFQGDKTIIGLVGTHRTGKTTLAKSWAKENDVPFVEISVSKVIQEETGGDCSQISSMDMRLKAQRKLVDVCDQKFLRRRDLFITDRTPIDVAAYTLAEVRQNDMTPAQQKEVKLIVEDCIDITNAAFAELILLQPDIPYVVEPGKPPLNTAYQDLVHYLCMGLMMDSRLEVNWGKVAMGERDHSNRMDIVDTIRNSVTEDAEILSKSVAYHS